MSTTSDVSPEENVSAGNEMAENRMVLYKEIIEKELSCYKELVEKEMQIKYKEITEKLNTYQDQTDNEFKTLRRKINDLESKVREKNIVIYGLDEQEQTIDQLRDRVWNLIDSGCNVKCDKKEIEFARRMGVINEKPRPVIVGLISCEIKRMIMRNRRLLFGTPITIQSDMTLDVRLKRKQLFPRLRYLREIGKYAFLRGDKLVVYESDRFGNYNNNFNRKRTFIQASLNEKTNRQILTNGINADTITIHEKGTPEICKANIEVITIDDADDDKPSVAKKQKT